MGKKIVNVKINGELVSSDTKITGVHLCGDHCPLAIYMKCPKVATSGNLPIMEYPFIIDGKQVIEERERVINKTTGETKKMLETTQLVVTKCKRNEMYKNNVANAKK